MSADLDDLHKDRLKELQDHDRNAVFRFWVWIAAGFVSSAVVMAVMGSLQAGLVLFGVFILAAISRGD
jgi:hypothetical protein